jgi:hypothetical protein
MLPLMFVNRLPPTCVISITLPRSPVSLSSGDEVPPHLYTKVASTARRIFDHQCKKTLATISALLGPREMSGLSPQSGPKRTLIRSPITNRDFMRTRPKQTEVFRPGNAFFSGRSQFPARGREARLSASQRARWRAGRGVRQRNAPLPTVYNCARSIVSNGRYPHTLDRHGARPLTSARLPCATLGKSSPPHILWAGRDRSPNKQYSFLQSHILI